MCLFSRQLAYKTKRTFILGAILGLKYSHYVRTVHAAVSQAGSSTSSVDHPPSASHTGKPNNTQRTHKPMYQEFFINVTVALNKLRKGCNKYSLELIAYDSIIS